jgi:hypothetical protein
MPFQCLPKIRDKVDGSDFGASSFGCLAATRLWKEGLAKAGAPDSALLASVLLESVRLMSVLFAFASILACSSALMASRWPSNTAVVQLRSFAVSEAQTFAAAAASPIGPATSRNCMPSPLPFSLITMIGRSVVRAAFDRDLRSPRHRARKPGMEFAPPTSTPNSVRLTTVSATVAAESGSAASGVVGATATISGIGADVTVFGGVGDSISFPAAGSGGAIIDFAAINEPDGWAAAGFGAGTEATVWFGSEATIEACLSATAAVVAATGATTGAGVGLAAAGGGSTDAVAAGAEELGGPMEGEAAGAAEADDAAEGPTAVAAAGLALACGDGDGGVEFCRAIAPVTESRPCSRTATRE